MALSKYSSIKYFIETDIHTTDSNKPNGKTYNGVIQAPKSKSRQVLIDESRKCVGNFCLACIHVLPLNV